MFGKEVWHETHVSAEEKAEKHGAWLPKENEHGKRQEGIAEKAQKGQKSFVRLMLMPHNPKARFGGLLVSFDKRGRVPLAFHPVTEEEQSVPAGLPQG